MRPVFLFLILFSFHQANAQTHFPVSSLNFGYWQPFPDYRFVNDSTGINQKWHFNTYSAVSAGFGFFNGGSATMLSVPVGLQLSRPLNNNLYAFAGLSVAPAFFSINSAFTNPAFNHSYPGNYMSGSYGFGLNSRVEMGLMYINDARTFSISGSIGVERSSFPAYPAERLNTKRQ